MAVVLAICVPMLNRNRENDRTVVLYCAHDSIFAEDIIRRFEARTGIDVEVRFDEEASKSLGLTNLLIAEKDNPRCDVFWNNQTLGTIRLQREGVLAAWKSTQFDRIPAQFKDPAGHWVGFAARMRVFVVNVDRMPATDEQSRTTCRGFAHRSSDRRTLVRHHTDAVCRHERRDGFEELRKWHTGLRSRGIHEARGNGAVKDLVATGFVGLDTQTRMMCLWL